MQYTHWANSKDFPECLCAEGRKEMNNLEMDNTGKKGKGNLSRNAKLNKNEGYLFLFPGASAFPALRTIISLIIGSIRNIFDDHPNESEIEKVAHNCYFPANDLMLELIRKHGRQFQNSLFDFGPALDQFEKYLPELIDSFKALQIQVCGISCRDICSLLVCISRDEFVRPGSAHTLQI